MLRYILFYYLVSLFPTLEHCWRILCLITLLYKANCKTFLLYTLFFHLAEHSHFLGLVELYSILTHCWDIPSLITLLGCSQSYSLAEVYLAPLRCWALPNLKVLLAYTLTCYIAEHPNNYTLEYILFPERGAVHILITLSRCILFYYLAWHFPILKHCRR